MQVKSRRELGSDRGWHFQPKHASNPPERLFYCLVDFGKSQDDHPAVYVLPSAKIAEVLTATYAQWLATPGRKGQAHNETTVRRLIPDYSKVFVNTPNPYPLGWLERYRDAWNLLGLSPTDVGADDDE